VERERHPRALPVLFFTEMWERFSFYLMLGILPLYLTDKEKGGLGMTGKEMAVIVGTYIALVYFTPFIGGLIADRLLGFRKTILVGAVLMMIGHLVLAVPTEMGLYTGLGFLILGNGAFKPNISTLLGNLYPKDSKLKDAGYNIFYMGINVGAFICNFIAAFVRNYFDQHPLHIGGFEIAGWHAAFSTAAFGMLFGLIIFASFYSMFAEADRLQTTVGEQQSLTPLLLECLLPALVLSVLAGGVVWFGQYCAAMRQVIVAHEGFYWDVVMWFPNVGKALHMNVPSAAFLAACLPTIVFYLRIWRGVEDRADRARTGALLVIFAVVIVFWAIFHLNTTALTTWTQDNTTRQPPELIEPLLVGEIGEPAGPSYYKNAGPEVPRPADGKYKVVSDEEYKRLQEAKELQLRDGSSPYVTQETPRLPAGQSLKLINTEMYQSINAGYVIIFTPLLVGFWAWLRRRGQEPTTPAKLGVGLAFTACGPLVMLAATYATQDGAMKGSSGWLFGTYAVVTVGELCLSPMGLSLVNKMSPKQIRAFMMGGWFLSTSFGNKLSGIFGELYEEMDHHAFWPMLAGSAAFFAGVIFVLLPWLNRQMGDGK